MAFNHPSSSKNNTGVITDHHLATLRGLQPVHDGNSHKHEITAKSIHCSYACHCIAVAVGRYSNRDLFGSTFVDSSVREGNGVFAS